jgi:hypothetical protein
MAKNFPYFKFTATEWLTGDIVYESLELQGLFINVCAVYWQRDGKLTIEDLIKRYKNESLINQLIDKYILSNNGNILIKFLDEQLIEANHISKVNSENGKKGAEAKRNKANAKRPLNDNQAILSKKEKELNKNNNNNKNKIREHVFISQSELDKLNSEFLEHEVNWMFDKLNDYKASKGVQYKSDYHAINMWVKKAFEKEKKDFIKDNNTFSTRMQIVQNTINNTDWNKL